MNRFPTPREPHQAAAVVAILSTGLFLLLLVAAHLLEPDLDPSTSFISELARGRHGWVMQAAFAALAIADVALFLAIRPWLTGAWGWGGGGLFLLGAIGVALGGLFVTDPINTPPEAASTSGQLHNLGGGLGLFGFLGSLLFSARLLSAAAWRPSRKAVLLATLLLVSGFLFAFVSIATIAARHDGVFGPDTPVGWPNRVGIVSGCVWILIVAWRAAGLDHPAE